MTFSRLEKDGMLDARWYAIYGPARTSGFIRKLKYSYKYGTDIEEYLYFGRVLAAAKFGPSENPSAGLKGVSDAPQERLKEYNFWFDIYELTLLDKDYLDCEICGEFQIINKIKCSNPALYNKKSQKYHWKKNDRRFKKITMELPEDKSQLPYVYLRIKKLSGSIFASDTYIGYLKFDVKDLINIKQVKPLWNKLRKCETKIDNLEDQDNFLGDVLCSFNCFLNTDKETDAFLNKRPILYDTKSFKKYKLVSIIYMGKNFPLKEEPCFCEINFYNEGKKPVKTDSIAKNAAPEWNDVLFITVMLNEGLELSENIKLSAKFSRNFLGPEIIGQIEIPVTEVDRYNHQTYLEKDLYKKAKWYSLEHPTLMTTCKVLARLFLVKLIKQDSEGIDVLTSRNLVPKNRKYYFLIFIIGVRNIIDNIEDGAVGVMYDGKNFEESRKNGVEGQGIVAGKETFMGKSSYDAANSFNNLDEIKDDDGFFCQEISDDNTFMKPFYVEVMDKMGYTLYDTFIDLDEYL